jgi:hypothetical protein
VEWVRNDGRWQQGQATARLDQRVCAPIATPPEEIESAWVLSGGTPINASPDMSLPPDFLPPDMDPQFDRGGVLDGDIPDFTRPDMGMPEAAYDTLLLFDQDSLDDATGTSGADFCGVTADCATAVAATLTLGGGEICRSEGPGCATDRASAIAILDDGSNCEAGSVPSDYVSVGTSGSIAVTFDGDLRGCRVTVVELAGAVLEGWEGFVCDSEDVSFANCVADDQPVHVEPAGGPATFAVPLE